MLYEVFPFFDELDLLWLRLNVLNATVDRFVLIEGRETFSLQPKPLCYAENKARFKAFEDKIVHVTYDRIPDEIRTAGKEECGLHQGEGRAFIIEDWVRGLGMAVLKDSSPKDLIILSDADEILPPNFNTGDIGKGIHHFRQRMYCYYLNGFVKAGWNGSTICRFNTLTDVLGGNLQLMRVHGHYHYRLEIRGGWHFTCMGKADSIVRKFQSYSHHYEYKMLVPDLAGHVKTQMEKGLTPFYDGNKGVYREAIAAPPLPSYVVEHQDEFNHLLWR
jgi:beta-1,4-mannosyl-glycoprotein beta-1,4-N-acetylglucosaminyltransferase